MSFAFEFRRRPGSALFHWERGGIEPVGVRLIRRIFGLQLHFGRKRSGRLGLVVEPACWGDQHEDNDEDYGEIVGPTATFIGPENGADNTSP